jgi:GH25 family lysozyme M1 (1,4-beta-N-acetylmuramidase)/LysM repeat protein
LKKKLPALVAATAAISMLTPAAALADVGFDAASYQGCYNAQATVNAGARFAMIKITQGNYYRNGSRVCQFDSSRAAGLRLAAYGFADTSVSPQADAAFFNAEADRMGLVGHGVLPVLDWEPASPGNVAWARTWLDVVSSHWGTKPLIYMSASTIGRADWSSVANADYGLWVAGYPNGYAGDRLRNPGYPPYSVGPWPFAAAWQYSSTGSVPGVGGAVDVDWFYGDAVTWAKYANAPLSTVTRPASGSTPSGVSPVQTTTTPTGSADALATAVIQGLYGNQPQRQRLLGSRYAEVMSIVNRRLNGAVTSSGSYVVRSGDYLSKVWPSTWPTVAALNGLRPPYTIYVGQRLRTTGAAASAGRRYTVRSGDTLGAIARRLGVSTGSIHGYRSGNPNLIYVGETIAY